MKINLFLNYCVRGGTVTSRVKEIGNDAGVCRACFAVIGADMVTTGNGPALPDLAPSTNASSPDVRGGCVADTMAQDPVAENAVRLATAFRISHGISEWPELSEEPTLHNWLFLQPPRMRQPRRVAGLDPATPAAVYYLRGSDSHLS
jgi:hypothetical protein